MKPKTKLQKEVAALSAKLPPLTAAQTAWIKRKAFSKSAYRCKSNTWCATCGNVFANDHAVCPCCGAKFKVIESRALKDVEKVYTTIHTTCHEFQVARHFLAERTSRKFRLPEYAINECVQIWINCNGKQTIMARPCYYQSFYLDLWNFNEPMSIKTTNSMWGRFLHDKYNISSFSNRICSVQPIIKRNGFKGSFYGITPTDLFSLLLTSPQAENLIKTRQYDLLRHLAKGKEIKHQHAVNICNRNGYIIKDASMWCDYVDLLEHFHLDTHNAHYVCPADLKGEHDRLVQRKIKIESQNKLQQQIAEAEKWESKYKKAKGKYFGIVFGDNTITISVITSVADMVIEGISMHHCVYANDYYKKPDSLILSAQDVDGNHIETVEISLKSFKVVQSRGVCNSNTIHHERILRLCQKNMYKIKNA